MQLNLNHRNLKRTKLFLMKTFVFIGLLVTVLFLMSCVKDHPEGIETSLDIALTDALRKASNTGSIDFFKFPASTDFENIPQDPKNKLSTSKVALGKLLFHETGLAVNPNLTVSAGTYSCASCHTAKAGFQACKTQGIGEGGAGFGMRGEGRNLSNDYPAEHVDVQPVRTPSALNVAYQENMLWNGQFGATGLNAGTYNQWTEDTPKETNNLGFEGVETQAIAGMDVHNLAANDNLLKHDEYKTLFSQSFPEVQNEQYTTEHFALAIAAYERTLLATEAPFQQWLKGNYGALNEQEKRGALLFFSKANCSSCHTGPALNSMEFYALGMEDLSQQANVLIKDEKEVETTNLGRGGFTKKEADNYKFKVPQLYNLKDSPFFGHGASFKTVSSVLRYKNEAVKENDKVADAHLSPEFEALNLSKVEIENLVAFIEHGLYDDNLLRYEPTELPSGNCFPNSDTASKIDLDCL